MRGDTCVSSRSSSSGKAENSHRHSRCRRRRLAGRGRSTAHSLPPLAARRQNRSGRAPGLPRLARWRRGEGDAGCSLSIPKGAGVGSTALAVALGCHHNMADRRPRWHTRAARVRRAARARHTPAGAHSLTAHTKPTRHTHTHLFIFPFVQSRVHSHGHTRIRTLFALTLHSLPLSPHFFAFLVSAPSSSPRLDPGSRLPAAAAAASLASFASLASRALKLASKLDRMRPTR